MSSTPTPINPICVHPIHPIHVHTNIMTSRTPSAILTPTAITGYLESGTGTNLLRRHDCALRAAEHLHRVWYPTVETKRTAVPKALRDIIHHFNTQYLTKPDNIPLVAFNLWSILFRRTYSHRQIKMFHEFIYIQQRYLDRDK